MLVSRSPFPDVERVDVDPSVLAGFTREWEFTALSVDLMREAASFACVAACTLGAEPVWNRDQAAVGGNVVRLFKLLSSLLDQTCQKRRETTVIIGRLAFETLVNIRFLIANFSPELVESYIRHSLRHERELWDEIQSNIAQRGGEVLPIETRMLASLERTVEKAGVKLDSIDLKDKAPWGRKHIRHKADAVGLGDAYQGVFGGMSHNVHGAWQDLNDYHLEANDEGGFTPKLEWRRPRPQLLLVLGVLVVEVLPEVFGFLGGEQALEQVRDRLADLHQRLVAVDQAHEVYLTRSERSRTA